MKQRNTQRISTGCSDRDRGLCLWCLWSTRHQYLRSQRSSMNKIVFLESLIIFDQICGQDCYCFFRMQRTIFPDKKTVLVGNPRGQEVKNSQKSAILASYDLDPKKKKLFLVLWRQSRSTENQSSDYRSNSAFCKERLSTVICFW